MKKHLLAVQLSSFLVICTAKAEATKNYDISGSLTPTKVSLQKPTFTYRLEIAPKSPWRLKTETPFQVWLKPTKGLTLDKTEFANTDLLSLENDKKAIQVAGKALEKGKQRLETHVSFFLCSDEVCQRFKEEISVKVEVQ